MDNANVVDFPSPETSTDPLNDLLRSGARQLIEQAVNVELQELLAGLSERRMPDGRAAIVRSGYQPEREVQTSIGPVPVKIPKVRARDGKPVSFHSALVPPYVRKSASLASAIPWLYLKGVSSGEMGEALNALVGPLATGLSAASVSRLKREWASEYEQWRQAPLGKDQWIYVWADGIYSGLRGSEDKLCALVVIGVNERGEKHFLAIENGVRESSQSWREVLIQLQGRGMKPPKLAIGDGAMGFWAAVEELWPQSKCQRCLMHKQNNVLNYLPKRTQPKAKEQFKQIWDAEKELDTFVAMFEAKNPKATLCVNLTPAFAVEVAAYAIMSNHYHLVLRVDTQRAAQWSWQQVVEQWHTVYNGNMLSQRFMQGETLPAAERKILQRFGENVSVTSRGL